MSQEKLRDGSQMSTDMLKLWVELHAFKVIELAHNPAGKGKSVWNRG
jgi:hypothetical protein